MILAINSGSSSLKFALFECGAGGERRVAEGAIESIGGAHGKIWFHHRAARTERETTCKDHRQALDFVFEFLSQVDRLRLVAVGHRVVHGGSEHVSPSRVDASLLASLKRIVPLAPLHMPASIEGIEAIAARRPDLPQVACFDTAFHATLPEVAWRLALPERFKDVRRYGFHGLSYEYILSTLGSTAPSRIVIAHLGNGASLAAVKDGRSIDTTMGLTPTGGILMGTRSGDLDPGALIYLLRKYKLDVDALENMVEHEAGLLGVGGASDMKTLLAQAPVEARARLAVEMFGYAVRKAIGAMSAALGGVELLVFTGGIGERAAPVRAEACRGLQAFGIELDSGRNARGEDVISTAASRTPVRVIATDEDLIVARHTRELFAQRRSHS